MIDNIYNAESKHINEKSAAQLIKKYLENENLKKLIIEYIGDDKILYTKLLCYQLMKLVVNSTTKKNDVTNWAKYVGIIEKQHPTFTAFPTDIIEIAKAFFGDLASKSRTTTQELLARDKTQRIIAFQNQTNETKLIIEGMLREIINKKIDYLIEYTKPLLSPFKENNSDIDGIIKHKLAELKSIIIDENRLSNVDSNLKKKIRNIKELFRRTYNPKLNKKYDKIIRENIKSKPNLKYMFGVIAKLHYLKYIIDDTTENKKEIDELMIQIKEHLFVFLISDKKIKSYDDNSSHKHYVSNSGFDIFNIFENEDEIRRREVSNEKSVIKESRNVLTNTEMSDALAAIPPQEKINYNKTSRKNYEQFVIQMQNAINSRRSEYYFKYASNKNNKRAPDVQSFDVQLNDYMDIGYNGTMQKPPIENIFTDRFPNTKYPYANKLYELYKTNKRDNIEILFEINETSDFALEETQNRTNPNIKDLNLTDQDTFDTYKIYSIEFLEIPDEKVLDLCRENNNLNVKQHIYANYDILYKIEYDTSNACFKAIGEGYILKISLVEVDNNISFSLKLHSYQEEQVGSKTEYRINNPGVAINNVRDLKNYAILKRPRDVRILVENDDGSGSGSGSGDEDEDEDESEDPD